MKPVRFHKTISSLPTQLDPDALYAVRVGTGFDFYVSDITGKVAHKINAGATDLSAITSRLAQIERRMPSTSATLVHVNDLDYWKERLQLYVQSRGGGMITNGSGALRDNTNFSRFRFDPTDLYAGFGCFVTERINDDLTVDEVLPVNPFSIYELSFFARMQRVNSQRPAKAYSYLACVDIDGQPITPDRLARFTFRLGANLSGGNNQVAVHPDDVQKIKTFLGIYGTSSAPCFLNTAEYTATSKYKFPTGTYSRNRITNTGTQCRNLSMSGNNLVGFAINSGINLNEGTVVSFGMADSTYLYGMMQTNSRWSANRTLANSVIPETWTEYKMRFVPRTLLVELRKLHQSLPPSQFLNPGEIMANITAGLKVGWLLNRETSNSRTAINCINFREV